MKWLLVFLILIISIVPTARPVLALSEEGITVVAVPDVGGAVTDFTAVMVSDTQVDLSWTKVGDTANVMVRAKYGEMPESRTDGYLVYEGSAENATDTSMNFDETVTEIYYRIWGQNGEGTWNDSLVNTDWLESIYMQLGVFVILCLGLTIGGYALRRPAIAMAGGGAWMILLAYSYIQAAGEWNVYMALMWVSLGMLIATSIEVVAMRSKGEEQAEEEVEHKQAIDTYMEEMNEEIDFRRKRRRENR